MKDTIMNKDKRNNGLRLSLFLYDFVIFLLAVLFLFVLYKSQQVMSAKSIVAHSVLSFVCIFGVRWGAQIYRQVWRYGGIQCYIRLLIADAVACLIYLILEFLTPIYIIAFARLLAFCSVNLLGSLSIRMFYRYAFTLYARLPSVLRVPLKASVTLLEATTPVKLPTMQCPRSAG